MGSRNLPLPFFPAPPTEYSQQFFAEFLRNFSVFMTQVQNPGEARATTIVLTALQSDDYELEVGAVFQANGFLKVTRGNVPHVRGFSVPVSVGGVTVVT